MNKGLQAQLLADFRYVVRRYVRAFEEKQGMKLEFWVGDDVGGVAAFGDVMFFSLEDIRLDIDADMPTGEILTWLYANLEAGSDKHINYYAWSKGLRHEHLVTRKSKWQLRLEQLMDEQTAQRRASDAEGGEAGSSERSEENGTPEQRGPQDAPNTSPQNQ